MIQVSSPTGSVIVLSVNVDVTLSSITKGKELVPKDKGKRKETFVEDINLEEEIVISNWDLSNLYADQKEILGELLKKRAKQQKL